MTVGPGGVALGGLAALASAFLFAVAALLFARLGEEVPAAGLNLGKGMVAVALTALLLAAGKPVSLGASDAALLGASGLLGITLGDTAYFTALTRLGPRRTLLLDTLGPGFAVLLAVTLLGERPAPWQWLGMGITLGGVAWVLSERSAHPRRGPASERVCDNSPRSEAGGTVVGLDALGLMAGAVAVLSHALGVIFSKIAVAAVPALEASMVRQSTALVGLVAWGGFSRRLPAWTAPLGSPRRLFVLACAAFCGSFLGIWLSLLGLKLAPAGIATTLNATTPLFILPLSAVFMGEHVGARAGLGAALAVAGAALLLW